MAVRITCINKSNGFHENPYTAITDLGWLNPNTGENGRNTREQMYDWIKSGGQAYVQSGAATAEVIQLYRRTGRSTSRRARTARIATISSNSAADAELLHVRAGRVCASATSGRPHRVREAIRIASLT